MKIKKAVKISGIVLLVFAALLLLLHLYIKHRAEKIFSDIIIELSHGKYEGKVRKITFSYIPLAIQAFDLEIAPLGNAKNSTFYIVKSNAFYGKIHSLQSLIFKRNLEIETVRIENPEIEVFQVNSKEKIEQRSVKQVVNDIRSALLKSLNAFEVKNCAIVNASFRYYLNDDKSRFYKVNHINLFVNDFIADSQNPQTAGISAKVLFTVTDPELHYPDSLLHIDLEKLELNSEANTFTINRLGIEKRKSVEDKSGNRIKLSNISLSGYNWKRWFEDGTMEIDKLSANDGETNFDFTGGEKANRKKIAYNDSAGIIAFLSPLIIHDLQINHIQHSLRSQGKKGNFSMEVTGDSLGVANLGINHLMAKPIRFDDLSLHVKNYSTEDDNDTYDAEFTGLTIKDGNLTLKDFTLKTLPGSPYGGNYKLMIPQFKIVGVDLEDAMEGRLTAKRLELTEPSFELLIPKEKRNAPERNDIPGLMADINPYLNLSEIEVFNAKVHVKPESATGNDFMFNNIDASINVDQLFLARQASDFIYAATKLKADNFAWKGKGTNLVITHPVFEEGLKSIHVSNLSGWINEKRVLFDVGNVSFVPDKKMIQKNNDHFFVVPTLSIGSGTITIQPNIGTVGVKKFDGDFTIQELNAPDVNLFVKDDAWRASAFHISASGKKVSFKNGQVFWNDLQINLPVARFETNDVHVTTGHVIIHQPGSILVNDIVAKSKKNGSEISFASEQILASASYLNTSKRGLHLDSLSIKNPIIHAVVQSKEVAEVSSISLPLFHVKNGIVDNATIDISTVTNGENLHITASGKTISWSDLQTTPEVNAVSIASMAMQMDNPSVAIGTKEPYSAKQLNLKLQDVTYNILTKNVNAHIDTAVVFTTSISIPLKTDSLFIDCHEIGLADYAYSTNDSITVDKLLAHHNWWLAGTNLLRQGEKQELRLNNFAMDKYHATASWDSFFLGFTMGRDTFWNRQTVAKPYNTFKIGKSQARDFRVERIGKKIAASAGHISMDSVFFSNEIDRRKPHDTIPYKPLLAVMLKKLPFFFDLDTAHLQRGYVSYQEIGEKSGREGYIYFDDITGEIYNFKNFAYAGFEDSMKATLAGQMMGKAKLDMDFAQSYYDSLQGFILDIKGKEFDLRILNPLLKPLVSVEINKGLVDSVWMRVHANNYVAYGHMDFHYNSLRFSVLKKGGNAYFLSGPINWLANAIVNSKDKKKHDIIFNERIQSRSMFGYWGKIAISGLLSNLGIKRDKQQLKRYKKFIADKNLPDYSNM